MQLTTATSAIKHTARSPLFWIILVLAILITAAAGKRLSRSTDERPTITDQGPALAMQSPFFLVGTTPPILIWQPLNAPTPLTTRTVSTPPVTTNILPYNDLAPRRWRAVPAGLNAYHIVWLEVNHTLRCALLSLDGETLRGPIDLADSAQPDFSVLPLNDGRAQVIWISQPTGQVITAVLDDTGRPSPPSNPILRRVDYLAAGIDQTDMVHLAWLTLAAPRSWTLHYQTGHAADFKVDIPRDLHTITLTSDQTITSFSLGLDESYAYLIWGVSAADNPDTERVYVLTFPLTSPDQTALNELRLPQTATPSSRLEWPIGQTKTPASPSNPAAALRWPSPAAGQHHLLPLALGLRTTDGWRPAVAYFQQGELSGYQIAAHEPADAGPPMVAVAPSGNLHLAWVALKGATAHVYTADTQ